VIATLAISSCGRISAMVTSQDLASFSRIPLKSSTVSSFSSAQMHLAMLHLAKIVSTSPPSHRKSRRCLVPSSFHSSKVLKAHFLAVGYFFFSTSFLAVACKCAAGSTAAYWHSGSHWAGPVSVRALDLAGRAH